MKAELNKTRDFPPSITSDDFIVDISFSPVKNLIALANIGGDVLLYEYSNEETKLLSTLELHMKACRAVEFDSDGLSLYSASKVNLLGSGGVRERPNYNAFTHLVKTTFYYYV